jgi:hypothetical protein
LREIKVTYEFFVTFRGQDAGGALREALDEMPVQVDLGLAADMRKHEQDLGEAATEVRPKSLNDLVA